MTGVDSGWRTVIDLARREGWYRGPIPKFGHAACVQLDTGQRLLGSFHPSQQNTFTGKLTEAMLEDFFATARRLLASPDRAKGPAFARPDVNRG